MKNPVFIGGAPRSGTTLLRVILDSHKDIFCGPEFRITPCFGLFYDRAVSNERALQALGHTKEGLAQAMQEFLSVCWEPVFSKSSKPYFAEKTPANCDQFLSLKQIFPDSKLVHCLRDGRDVVCSILAQGWIDANTGEPLEQTNSLEGACKMWDSMVREGLKARNLPNSEEHYFELRYEELVSNPEPVLRKLFTFLERDWDESVLSFYEKDRNLAGEASSEQVNQPIYQKSLGRWKREFTDQDKELVKNYCSDLLVELGYEEDLDW